MNQENHTTTGILRQMGGRLAPPTTAQRSWRLALVALLLLPQTVVPATITVDADVGAVGCDLVEAIENANDDAATNADCVSGGGPDTIDLMVSTTLTTIDNAYPAYYGFYTYLEYNGLPVVTSDITIDGNDNTISRSGAAPGFRIFAIASSGTLTLNDATISGGSATEYSSFGYGYTYPAAGGAIFSYGTVSLANSTVSGNYGNFGGGLYSSFNTTSYPTSYPTTTLTSSTVSGNYADFGGGIANRYGPLTATDSTISGNYADFGGGLNTSGSGAYSSLVNSTVSGNTAGSPYGTGRGGGIYTGFSASTSLTNSTVSANTAYGSDAFGGGIFTGEDYAVTTLTNSTVSGNAVAGTYTSLGANVYTGYYYYYDYYYGGYSYIGTTNFYNTIVTDGVGATDCLTVPGAVAADLGGNFSEDGTCPPGFPNITTGVDIDGTLADNGGPTETHALFAGSAAIDAAGACPLLFDQRGEPRSDGLCDSGSYEFGISSCEQSLRDLAAYILALPLSDFVGSSSARRSILASRAVGAANAMKFCAERTALIRLNSLIMLVDGIGRDFMVSTPNDVTTMAQDLYDIIAAGECPECAP